MMLLVPILASVSVSMQVPVLLRKRGNLENKTVLKNQLGGCPVPDRSFVDMERVCSELSCAKYRGVLKGQASRCIASFVCGDCTAAPESGSEVVSAEYCDSLKDPASNSRVLAVGGGKLGSGKQAKGGSLVVNFDWRAGGRVVTQSALDFSQCTAAKPPSAQKALFVSKLTFMVHVSRIARSATRSLLKSDRLTFKVVFDPPAEYDKTVHRNLPCRRLEHPIKSVDLSSGETQTIVMSVDLDWALQEHLTADSFRLMATCQGKCDMDSYMVCARLVCPNMSEAAFEDLIREQEAELSPVEIDDDLDEIKERASKVLKAPKKDEEPNSDSDFDSGRSISTVGSEVLAPDVVYTAGDSDFQGMLLWAAAGVGAIALLMGCMFLMIRQNA
ncbi:MAG: uncharacterized protein KVP18_003874 [Porospora cf. gigantea A]|uniref:uncharacterized protein n=2 Tax=Porospora cf. gigantea A TaxID=2853593 RepID=UPI00355A3CED|nr:MAG: hypothetical protein KVP18_003874 [Porospora cf. gigantea A]